MYDWAGRPHQEGKALSATYAEEMGGSTRTITDRGGEPVSQPQRRRKPDLFAGCAPVSSSTALAPCVQDRHGVGNLQYARPGYVPHSCMPTITGQGDKWCIYPMYDWAHGLRTQSRVSPHSALLSRIRKHRRTTGSLRNRHLHPRQIEFARMNLPYTVMSKRRSSIW